MKEEAEVEGMNKILTAESSFEPLNTELAEENMQIKPKNKLMENKKILAHLPEIDSFIKSEAILELPALLEPSDQLTDINNESITTKHMLKETISTEEKQFKKHKNKRAEIMEDPDLDMEIATLTKSNLKNQAHTLRFSRLMVRAKLQKAKSQLLCILRSGELACRRLFLDYHGLKLLYTWMCDLISTDMKVEWTFRLEILETLDVLPIPNKLLLQDSKVLATVRKWANTGAKENNSKSPDESQSDSGSGTPISDDTECPSTKTNDLKYNTEVLKNIPQLIEENSAIKDIGVEALKEIINTNESNENKLIHKTYNAVEDILTEEDEYADVMEQIRFIASKLVAAWELLPEVFRIPKKLRIEQMKEHEREANRNYSSLGLSDSTEKIKPRRYKEKHRERDKESGREYDKDRYRCRNRIDIKDPEIAMQKLQRRQMFEAKVKDLF